MEFVRLLHLTFVLRLDYPRSFTKLVDFLQSKRLRSSSFVD
jgi:hypothetical protein